MTFSSSQQTFRMLFGFFSPFVLFTVFRNCRNPVRAVPPSSASTFVLESGRSARMEERCLENAIAEFTSPEVSRDSGTWFVSA